MTNSSQADGVLAKTTSLTCEDTALSSPITAYSFKIGSNEIYSHSGQGGGASGKYNGIIHGTSIELQIMDTAVIDATTYSCTIGFQAPVTYTLTVEG